MNSYLIKVGLSILVTSIIFTAGKSIFPYDFKEAPQQSEIEKEFVSLYQVNQDITSPRARLIKDLKQLYSSENPPTEIVSKINFPDQYYPLLDDEMKNFLFLNSPTGNKLLTKETVECSMGNNKLYVDGGEVSQDLYRITGPGHNNYYQTCTKLVAETRLELKNSVPKLLLKIEGGEYNKIITQIPTQPTNLELFFGNLLSIFGIFKILSVLSTILLTTFIGKFLSRAKSSVSAKISQLKPPKSELPEPKPTDRIPASFMAAYTEDSKM